jgi:hypothetical protein
VRLAENLQEPFLLRRLVVALRRSDPDLSVQRNATDGLPFQVLDAQLEDEARGGRILEDFGALHPEVEVRHG